MNAFKKMGSLVLMTGVAFFGVSPSAFAEVISVSNNNSATITNSVSVGANSGGNTSRGAAGEEGGHGGDATGSGESSNTGGDGGRGGDGGDGGTIQTGLSIATVEISNDVNTSETTIETTEGEPAYNETLDIEYHQQSSESETEDMTSLHTDNSSSSHFEESSSESSSSANNASNPPASSSSSSDWQTQYDTESDENQNAILDLETSSSGAEAQQSEDFELHATRTLACDCNDEISVDNTNDATLTNALAVNANSGDNLSEGDEGGSGGDATGSGQSSNTGGQGGAGGMGGDGEHITTGTSDSLASIVTVSGRTITRITRN